MAATALPRSETGPADRQRALCHWLAEVSGAERVEIARIPMRRIAQPADLDGALLFLASPASAYVTGAVVSVDGGHGIAAI